MFDWCNGHHFKYIFVLFFIIYYINVYFNADIQKFWKNMFKIDRERNLKSNKSNIFNDLGVKINVYLGFIASVFVVFIIVNCFILEEH